MRILDQVYGCLIGGAIGDALGAPARPYAWQYIQDAVDNALRLRAPSVSLCPGMTLFGEDLDRGWGQLRQSIVELLDYTEGTDLVLLIEPAHQAESTLTGVSISCRLMDVLIHVCPAGSPLL